MATNKICDFCGKRADVRGSGVLKILTSFGNAGRSWDYCKSCRALLMELLSTTSFKPEQQPLALVEVKGRTMAEIQLEIDDLMILKEKVIGRERPEIMQRMLDCLNKELKSAMDEVSSRIVQQPIPYTV